MRKLIYLIAIFSTPVFATKTIECEFTRYSDDMGNYALDPAYKLTFLTDNSDGKTYMQTGGRPEKSRVESTPGTGETFIKRDMLTKFYKEI